MQKVSTLVSKDIGDTLTNIRTWSGVMYNVLNQGLVGGGTTDDTAALQTLINTAIAAGRKAIFFPHGTNGQYRVTALTNADQVVFFGDNASFVGGYIGHIFQIGSDDTFFTDFLSRQAIINGNFDVWQREASFNTPASASYAPDRWLITYNGTIGTFAVSRQTFTIGQTDVPSNPKYYLRWDQTASGSGSTFRTIGQKIEGVQTFSGGKCTLSFYAKADAARTISQATLRQNFGTGGTPSAFVDTNSSSFNLTTSWQKFTYTFTLPSISGKTLGTNGDDFLQLSLFLPINTTMTIDIAQVQLCAGDVALPFQPRSFAEELALCQRYYEKSYNINVAPATATNAGSLVWTSRASDSLDDIPIQFKTIKRLAPTITLYNPATGTAGQARDSTAATNLAIASGNTGTSGTQVNVSAPTTTAHIYLFHYVADAEL